MHRPRPSQVVAALLAVALCWLRPTLAGARSDPVADATAANGLYVVFDTTLGTIVCQLDYDKVPVTVGNFVGLAEGTREFTDRDGKKARRPFYDGLKFHRVVPGFVVQGGCPRGDGTGGPGYTFTDEFESTLRHDRRGILSMASSGPDDNGCQFFITLAPAPHLDGVHSVFGHVVAGSDVLQRMEKQELRKAPKYAEESAPVTDIVMRRVSIVRTGTDAQAFDASKAFARAGELKFHMDRERATARRHFRDELEADRKRALRTHSGLLYIVHQEGKGTPPQLGDVVLTECIGYLDDGTKFWSSYDTGKPFKVALGAGKLIRGWEEAYLTMHPGEKRRLIIPAALAYGHQGNKQAGIPPDATLVLDVEFLNVVHH